MLYLRLTLLVVVAMAWPVSWHSAVGLSSTLPDGRAADLVTAPDSPMPLYKPRKNHAPRARIGGQSRGAESGAPLLIALVPDHVAFTIKGDPSLCWYLSLPTTHAMTVTVVDSRGIRPILERALPSPLHAGIHCTRPREYGIELREQESYRWFVTLVVDPDEPSRDIVAGGTIERLPFSEACSLGMPCTWTSCDRDAIYRYSESGLWYDAIACLLDLITHGEDKQSLERMLHHLLNQSGVYLPT